VNGYGMRRLTFGWRDRHPADARRAAARDHAQREVERISTDELRKRIVAAGRRAQEESRARCER